MFGLRRSIKKWEIRAWVTGFISAFDLFGALDYEPEELFSCQLCGIDVTDDGDWGLASFGEDSEVRWCNSCAKILDIIKLDKQSRHLAGRSLGVFLDDAIHGRIDLSDCWCCVEYKGNNLSHFLYNLESQFPIFRAVIEEFQRKKKLYDHAREIIKSGNEDDLVAFLSNLPKEKIDELGGM